MQICSEKKPTLYVNIFVLSALFSMLFSVAGCRTRREIVMERTDLANMSFEYVHMAELPTFDGEKEASFVLWNRTEHQSHHVLQLAPQVQLKERHHRKHDITIFGVTGRAIVSVDGKRRILEPGVAIFVPRMHAYAVIPHESPGNVVAVMVFSPPFDGKDTLILER